MSTYDNAQQPLSFASLKEANDRRNLLIYPYCQKWDTMHWGCALAGEVGELCNRLKKWERDDIKQGENYTDYEARKVQERDEIGKEIADVVLYADLLASKLKLTLSELVRAKFNEVSKRKGSDIVL